MARLKVGRAMAALLTVALVFGHVAADVAAGPRDRDRQEDRGGDDGDAGGGQPAGTVPVPGDSDGDADYFPDAIDNCPGVPNADQGDGDGVGDACQARAPDEGGGGGGDGASDIDGDGVGDNQDNCREVHNGGQGDADGDGIGNQCDGSPSGDPVPEPDPTDRSSPADGGSTGGGGESGGGESGGGESGGGESGGGGRLVGGDESGGGNGDGGGGSGDSGAGEAGGRDREPGDESVPTEQRIDGGNRAPNGTGDGNGNGQPPPGDGDGDGEAPAQGSAPRPPEGPPPALKPFVVPESSYEPIIRIDAGFPSAVDAESAADGQAAPRERAADGAQDEPQDEPAPERSSPERADPVRPAPDRSADEDERDEGEPDQGEGDEEVTRPRPGDGFVDREESMLGGPSSPAAEDDPLDGDAAPEDRRRGWAAEAATDRLLADGDDARRGWMTAGIDAQVDPEGGVAADDLPLDPELLAATERELARSRAASAPEPDADDVFDAGDAPEPEPDRPAPAVRSRDGAGDWADDDHYAGGTAQTRAEVARILGTERDRVYLSQRVGRGDGGSFAYEIPLPSDGTYLVRLHFAEIYWGAAGGPEAAEGQRVFSVDAEGRTQLADYDVAADVGPMTAVVKEFETDVDDGVLDLDFYASRDQPAVAAIEVLAQLAGERWVDVDKSNETVRLMVGDRPVASYRASLSEGAEDDFHDTMPGSYRIQSKIAELTWTPYANNYFMYWAGFDPGRENGFHSWVMDYRGRVVPDGDGPTWGCVATAPEDAAAIYNFVDIGTPVEIHW